MKRSVNWCTAVRRALACQLALLTTLSPLLATDATDNWDAVRELTPGHRIRVLLEKSPASPKGTVVKGRFASATENQITVLTSDGSTRSFRKDGVRQIRVRVPFLSRRPAWRACAVAGGAMGFIAAIGAGDMTVAAAGPGYCALFYGLFSSAGRTRPVYDAGVVSKGSPPTSAGSGEPSSPDHQGGTGAVKALVVESNRN